jgi:hypothetical protein
LGPQEVLEAAGLSLDASRAGDTEIVADWRLRWPRTLVGPVGALGDEGRRPRSLGLVSFATMRLGASTSPAARERVQLVRAAFGRGERDALEPVVDQPPPAPEADPPAADDDARDAPEQPRGDGDGDAADDPDVAQDADDGGGPVDPADPVDDGSG